ncbi:MAG: bifunctional metallophosphatase/5'-nucleotidase [Phycisphaerae bacterium]|nr:bifunctional metallophosphatase/5'-nucleotidase [Gemmatimonadaceae bacterium]
MRVALFARGHAANMRRQTTVLAAGALLCLSACAQRATTGAASAPQTSSASRVPTVRFLLVNDVYVADTLRDGTGGLSRVAALRDSIERATNSRVLYVLAGDVLSPSLLGKWYGGAQMVEAFNASRLDFAAIGNHEFDNSRANLIARVAESKFPWLTGNCLERGGKAFPAVKGWDTVTVDGVRVGIFGTTIVREYPAYVQCANADTVTRALVDTLSRAQAELIVGLTHRNHLEDLETLRREPSVQAILGGHDHKGRRDEVDGRLVIKAVSNARTAAFVTFAWRNGKWERRDTSFTIGSRFSSEPRTEAVVAAWRDTLARRIGMDRVLGVTPVMIDATDTTQHRRETVFGDLITDAMRIGTGADVALINSGALRYDDYIDAGPVSTHMLESIFLFADETRAVTFNLTGARLRALLEHGVEDSSLGEGPYLQLSGVKYTYDTRRPNGQRIAGAVQRADGRPIADSETLRVTLVTFPACRGGDGYKVPEAAEACRAIETNPNSAPRTAELLIRHIEGMGGRVVLPVLDRVKRVP